MLLFVSGIPAGNWKEVTHRELGFQVLMPGNPREEQKSQQTPVGNVETYKFTVMAMYGKEMYLIVTLRFPDAISQQMGGPEKLLQLAKQDVIVTSRGEIQSEKPIMMAGYPGLELEVSPEGGGIMRIRVYATRNQTYQVYAMIPKARQNSNDVERFLDSFLLLATPDKAPARAGK
jgi:hypothetical protein